MKEDPTPSTVRVRIDQLMGTAPRKRPVQLWGLLLIPIMLSAAAIWVTRNYTLVPKTQAAPIAQASPKVLLEDLVCHGPVDPDTTPFVYEYQGQKIYFDKKECMDKFIANPVAYASVKFNFNVAPASGAPAPPPPPPLAPPAADATPADGITTPSDAAPVIEPGGPAPAPTALAPEEKPPALEPPPAPGPATTTTNPDLVTEPAPPPGPEVPLATPELSDKKPPGKPAQQTKSQTTDDGPSTVEDVPPPK